jgi:hypothetical protein
MAARMMGQEVAVMVRKGLGSWRDQVTSRVVNSVRSFRPKPPRNTPSCASVRQE